MKILFLFVALLLTACTLPKRSVMDLNDVSEDQVVLVGRLSINRKMPESTNVWDVLDVTKGAIIRASGSPLPLLNSQYTEVEKGDMLVTWGELFSVPYERFPAVYFSGIYALVYDKKGQESYHFPVLGSIQVPAKSKYLYVGHIRLAVDEFYSLQSVKVTDEFQKDGKALARFKGIKKSLFKAN